MTAHGARDVVANIPVCIRAALCGGIEVVVVTCRPQVGKALTYGKVRLTAYPKTLRRLRATGLLEYPASHKLPFASGIRGNDDTANILPVKKMLHDLELILGLVNDHGLKLLWQNWEVPQLPTSIFGPIEIRRTQRDKMPQGPRHDIIIAFKILAPVHAPKHAGKLLSNTRLLSKN